MKIIKITLVIALFLLNSHGQDTSVEDAKTVSLSLTLIKYDQSNLALAIKLRNNGTVPAYVAVDPVHPNGKKAYYLTLGDDNSLLIESRVFGPRANVHYLKDQTKVDLKRLEPLEEYDLEIKLQTPLRDTFPSLLPNKSATTFRDRLYRKIDLSTTRRIQVNIGYFEASKGIDDLLSRMIGTAVNGIMSLAVGTDQNKSLYEIQKLATGEIRLQNTTRSGGYCTPNSLNRTPRCNPPQTKPTGEDSGSDLQYCNTSRCASIASMARRVRVEVEGGLYHLVIV